MNTCWVDGYYPNNLREFGQGIEEFRRWEGQFSMGPSAEDDWVWIKGDYYTREQVQKHLDEKTFGTKAEHDKEEEV